MKCGNVGYLIAKQTVSKCIRYRYWYVKHPAGKKIKWCYIGKDLPKEYGHLSKGTQIGTQSRMCLENLNLGSVPENRQDEIRAGRLAWLGHWLYEPKVAGSSPVRPTTHQHSHCFCCYSLN